MSSVGPGSHASNFACVRDCGEITLSSKSEQGSGFCPGRFAHSCGRGWKSGFTYFRASYLLRTTPEERHVKVTFRSLERSQPRKVVQG